MKMKTFKHLTLAALVGFVLVVGSGCSKKTVDAPGVGVNSRAFDGGTEINYPAADGSGYTESSLNAEGTLDDTGSSLTGTGTGNLSVNTGEMEQTEEYKREHGRSSVGLSPIYFAFDQAAIPPEMADRMANNALFLKQIPGAKVVVEGNCDERGTNEYNMALGQRRALNAQEYLINLGVEPGRIRTVSYGEERPLFLGQDEFSYAQNRRNDFILE
ncbi:MAG: peptidoglycan-associated lipoprotein Pal [Desulfopila sp.]|jgi:peptidoglycan-associated lipoprotein|nr:peptidoglycan-associated lipoprotein Pal [Desulfopila sp.]